jgi:hypothetical protein
MTITRLVSITRNPAPPKGTTPAQVWSPPSESTGSTQGWPAEAFEHFRVIHL